MLLSRLRALSIRAVELIVLWRDQLRYLALLSTKHRPLRRKRAQQSIQTPYLTDQGENYLLKMKTDTRFRPDGNSGFEGPAFLIYKQFEPLIGTLYALDV